jgi:hypothetical protein
MMSLSLSLLRGGRKHGCVRRFAAALAAKRRDYDFFRRALSRKRRFHVNLTKAVNIRPVLLAGAVVSRLGDGDDRGFSKSK